jgi:hypothetical protein
MRLCVSAIRLNFRVNAGEKRRLLGQAENIYFSITVYGLRFRVDWKPDVRVLFLQIKQPTRCTLSCKIFYYVVV